MDALIIDAVRSPIGRKNGALSRIRGDDLAAQVLNGLIAPHDLDPGEIEDVQMGCVTQIGEQGWNVGRMAVLAAGWPVDVAATTVDRQCGSSMQTNFNAAAAVMAGQLDVVVSAGVEMMSRVPMGSNGGSISERVTDRHEIVMQGTSAELLAREWNLTRDDVDAYSLESHRRAVAASDERPLRARDHPDRARRLTMLAVDEAPRRETSAEALAALRPAFDPDGVVTAGNSSQIVDGAAAVLITSEAAAARLGLEPRGALRLVRSGRRRPDADAARQPDRDAQGTRQGRAVARRDERDRGQRGVRDGGAADGSATCTSRSGWTTSTRTAVGSRSATRSVRPARASRRRCSTSSTGAAPATGSRRCASGSAWRSPASSSASSIGRGATINTVGVVGLGAMGSGSRSSRVEAGFDTIGHEVELSRGEAARDRIAHFLTRKVEKGQLDQAARDAAVGRLQLDDRRSPISPTATS